MSMKTATRSGFISSRIIHLHPSRFCNLACKHCYSVSGPSQKSALRSESIISALAILKEEGYEVVSLSGGEPLLYSGLKDVVEAAVNLGYRINLITNGALLAGPKLDLIEEYVDMVAISLDGAPETHNHMRQSKHAFRYVTNAIARLRERNLPFGFSFCVSQKSLSEMPWAADFATSEGAALLQFHPFAAIGRGLDQNTDLQLHEDELTRVYAIASLLQSENGPLIQVDLAPLSATQAYRNDYDILNLNSARDSLLSTLINPLVVTETGQLLPMSYGFNPLFSLGHLELDLRASIKEYKEDEWLKLRSIIKQAFDRLDTNTEGFIDWFNHIVQTSYVNSDLSVPITLS